jgi:hypothetical protein
MTTNIFYHLPSLGDYKARFSRTYEKILISGLMDKIDNFFILTNSDSISFLDNLNVTVIKVDELPKSERPTLMYLKNFAIQNDGYSLYLHCKGSSRPFTQSIQDWIDMLDYFCIEQFEQCLVELDNGYNIVGCNFKKDAEEPHFCGNFWWANNEYIATLPDINSDDRVRCEMWVGKGANLKVKTFHDSPVNHYHSLYPPSNYRTN